MIASASRLVVGNRLVASFRSHRETFEMQRLDFFPRGAAQLVHVPFDRARHRVERHAHHAVHTRRRFGK